MQDGAGQVLSICFRLYAQSRGSPKVVSTAAATIRQAVALLFDHTVAEQQAAAAAAAARVVGMAAPTAAAAAAHGCGMLVAGTDGLTSGREMAAMLLLQDLMNMCAGGFGGVRTTGAVCRYVQLFVWCVVTVLVVAP